jgi:hypothetical protein
MHLADVLGIALAVGACAAFLVGEHALAGSEDLRALYWLAVGAAALYGAVQIVKPGQGPGAKA